MFSLLTRILAFTCACACLLASSPARAQFQVDIRGVGATQLPIAVGKFRGEDLIHQSLAEIVRADLERSGVFRIVPADAVVDEAGVPNFNDWRARAADTLVGGSITRLADGRFDVRYRIWDVVKGVDLGLINSVQAADFRLAAHRVADAIFEKLTGQKGAFSTRIAYVARSGKQHTLFVSDADGVSAQPALNSTESIISPAWSPNGRELAYVSFEKQKAMIYVQEILTGKRRIVADFKGTNSAPAWSPDGEWLAATLSREGGSQLFVMSRTGENLRRLTISNAIDTEAVFSPDGGSIYFVSDRGGAPQIYRTPTSGGPVERVTFVGTYNISPAISPNGSSLAYISRLGGSFRLHLMDLNTGTVQALTESDDDESPSFAPNGRLILYTTREQGRDLLMTTTLDGKFKSRLLSTQSEVREPAWGPFGR